MVITMVDVPSSYISNATDTPDDIKRKRRVADALIMQSMQTSPVQHWTQGAARVAQALLGGYQNYLADESDRKREGDIAAAITGLPGLGGGAPSVAPPVPDTIPQGPSPTITASPIAPATATPAARVAGTFADLPRGYRNNNPLNIEAGSFTQGQPGYLGSDGRFARFASLDQGIGAADTLLNTYDRKYGLNTVNGIINRWAPPGENNSSAYAATVAKRIGVDPNAPLAPDQRRPLIEAMAQYENGRPLPQTTPAGGVPGPASLTAPAVLPPGAAQPTRAVPAIPPEVAMTIKRLMINPNTRAYGFQLYQQYAKPNNPTDEMREYDLYRQQGGNKSFFDYKSDLKKAGAIQNQVQIDQKGENEFSKEAGKLQAKQFADLTDDAAIAKQMMSDIDTLRALGEQIGTGKGAEARAVLGPYAQALNIDVKGLNEIQAYEAIVNRVAPNLRVKGSGAQSDYELRNFMKSLPSIGATPQGNELISRTLQGLYQNKIRAAEIGSKALNKEISPPEAQKQLRELPDPMAEYREYMKGQKKAGNPAENITKSGIKWSVQ